MVTSGFMVALSVLDLSPVTTATPPSVALNNSLDLARLVDRLRYTPLWLPAQSHPGQYPQFRPRHHDRAGGGDHQAPARRLGRRDAAEPCAADGDGALQGAG